jgi:hypothetical protein
MLVAGGHPFCKARLGLLYAIRTHIVAFRTLADEEEQQQQTVHRINEGIGNRSSSHQQCFAEK